MAPARPTAIGAFVLGGIAIVVAAILFFGSGELFTRTNRAVVYFEGSVGGLVAGAPVTFRGVHVGSVASVSLVLNPGDLKARIPVYLQLDPDKVVLAGGAGQLRKLPPLPRLIEAGLRAKLVSQSFVTGQMSVELDLAPETPAHFIAPEGTGVPEIPATPSDLQELRDQLTRAPIAQTIVQAQRTLIAIEHVANHLDTELGPLTASVQKTLDSATRTMNIASGSIQHVEQGASDTLQYIQVLARDGRRQLDGRGAELSKTLLSSQQAIHSANELLASANSLIAVNSSTRDDLQATIRDLAATASSLRTLSRTVERDPSVLLLGRLGR